MQKYTIYSLTFQWQDRQTMLQSSYTEHCRKPWKLRYLTAVDGLRFVPGAGYLKAT